MGQPGYGSKMGEPTVVHGTRMLNSGIALTVLGLVMFGFGAIAAFPFWSSVASSPIHAVPGQFAQELDPGDYVISVQAATRTGPISYSLTGGVDIERLSISDPTGATVAVRDGRNQTVNRNGAGFVGVAVFTADQPGTYTVELVTSAETNALITRSLDLASLAQAAVAALGSIAVVAGLVLAGIGYTRRKRHRELPPPA